MAETLGMLCDKLTIVKLKEYHTSDPARPESLANQAIQLQKEIDGYVTDAVAGNVDSDRLTFAANKVFSGQLDVPEAKGGIAEVFYQLADVNCRLWHEQEKVYEFEKVPAGEKDEVVKKLAVLNLQRNNCIDSIDRQFAALIGHPQKR